MHGAAKICDGDAGGDWTFSWMNQCHPFQLVRPSALSRHLYQTTVRRAKRNFLHFVPWVAPNGALWNKQRLGVDPSPCTPHFPCVICTQYLGGGWHPTYDIETLRFMSCKLCIWRNPQRCGSGQVHLVYHRGWDVAAREVEDRVVSYRTLAITGTVIPDLQMFG